MKSGIINTALFFLLIFTFQLNAQEKLKGNRIVVTEDRFIYNFNKVEVNDNIDVVINQGTEPSVTVETDENLQFAVITEVIDSTLVIKLSEKISRKKELLAHITVNQFFKELITKDKSDVKTLSNLQLRSFTLNAEGDSKVSLTLGTTAFYLNNLESANVNLNISSEEVYLRGNKSGKAKIKADTKYLEIIGQGNSSFELEGKTNEIELKAENRSDVKAAALECNEAIVMATDNSTVHINVRNNLDLSVLNDGEVNIYNNPKIKLEKFADKAVLKKK